MMYEEMEREIWKDIEGYEGYYQVSNFGNLRSLERYLPRADGGVYKVASKQLKTPINRDGYPTVRLYKNRKATSLKVHRLVAITFIPNHQNKKVINHIDGDKTNNKIDNLEWVTHKENTLHAYKTGLKKPPNPNANGEIQGEKNSGSKLTNEKVRFIRKNARVCGGNFTNKQLANMFNVGETVVSNIIHRKKWKHVSEG